MNGAQTQLYWREWGAVTRRCKKEGWAQPNRHELHVKALGYQKSSKDLSNAEFDKVLGVFRAISQPTNVNAQIRQERQPRTRIEHKIKIDQVKLLAVVLSKCLRSDTDGRWDGYKDLPALAPAAAVEPDTEAAFEFVARVMMERFGTDDLTQISDAPQVRFVRDMRGKLVLREGEPIQSGEYSDLELLMATLAARINTLRNDRGHAGKKAERTFNGRKLKRGAHTVSGWTIHEMNQAAGVKCEGKCATCYPPIRRMVRMPLEEKVAA